MPRLAKGSKPGEPAVPKSQCNVTELKETDLETNIPIVSHIFSHFLTFSHIYSQSWSGPRVLFHRKNAELNWNLLIADLAQVLPAALVEVQLRLVFCAGSRASDCGRCWYHEKIINQCGYGNNKPPIFNCLYTTHKNGDYNGGWFLTLLSQHDLPTVNVRPTRQAEVRRPGRLLTSSPRRMRPTLLVRPGLRNSVTLWRLAPVAMVQRVSALMSLISRCWSMDCSKWPPLLLKTSKHIAPDRSILTSLPSTNLSNLGPWGWSLQE